MIQILEAIPTPFLLLLVVGGTAVITALITYLIRTHVSEAVHTGNNEVAGFLFAGVSVIYGVLLAFLVLVVWQTFQDAALVVEQESNTLVDIFRIGQELPDPYSTELQSYAIEYANRVVNQEWPLMVDGHESKAVGETIEKFWMVHRAVEADPTAIQLHSDKLFELLEALGNNRRIRLLDSRTELPGLMWALLIGGGLVTIGFTFFFRAPTSAAHLSMAAMFAGLLAFVLVLIIELDSPFAGSVRLEPRAFQQALELFAQLQGR